MYREEKSKGNERRAEKEKKRSINLKPKARKKVEWRYWMFFFVFFFLSVLLIIKYFEKIFNARDLEETIYRSVLNLRREQWRNIVAFQDMKCASVDVSRQLSRPMICTQKLLFEDFRPDQVTSRWFSCGVTHAQP